MTSLAGRRVLVVEDDYMIATDLVDVLAAAGAVPVGPAGWMEQALAVASDRAIRLDFAILDINLHGAPSYPVADALAARGIPVMFTTGFGADAVDPAYREHPRLEKPVSERALLQAIKALP